MVASTGCGRGLCRDLSAAREREWPRPEKRWTLHSQASAASTSSSPLGSPRLPPAGGGVAGAGAGMHCRPFGGRVDDLGLGPGGSGAVHQRSVGPAGEAPESAPGLQLRGDDRRRPGQVVDPGRPSPTDRPTCRRGRPPGWSLKVESWGAAGAARGGHEVECDERGKAERRSGNVDHTVAGEALWERA